MSDDIHIKLRQLPPSDVKRALKRLRRDDTPRNRRKVVEALLGSEDPPTTGWIEQVRQVLADEGYPEFAERFKADPPDAIPSEEEIAAQADAALVKALRTAGYPEFAAAHEAKGRKLTKAARHKQVKALRDAGYDDAADLHEKGAPTGLPPDIDHERIADLTEPGGYVTPWQGDGLERQLQTRLDLYEAWSQPGVLKEQQTVIHASDFGAGVDATPEDNRAAFTAAMDAAREQGGGRVVSPVPLIVPAGQVLPRVAGSDEPLLPPHVVTITERE